jgi:hypothetical protein
MQNQQKIIKPFGANKTKQKFTSADISRKSKKNYLYKHSTAVTDRKM